MAAEDPMKPIGVSWGRVARQIIAFLLAVTLILLFFEYIRTFGR